MYIIDLNIRENLASFFERMEPDEKKRDALLKILAPHICLGPVCETIEGALGYRSNEGAREWIAQWDLPEKTINAAVIRRANGMETGIPLYTLLQHVATHLREVSIDMVKPDWRIIRHAYIEARCLTGWEAAAKQALAGKVVEISGELYGEPAGTGATVASTPVEPLSQLDAARDPQHAEPTSLGEKENKKEIAKIGGQARAAKYAPIKAFAMEQANLRSYPSTRQAAIKIKDSVLEFARVQGAPLSEDRALQTLQEWLAEGGFKPSNKQT